MIMISAGVRRIPRGILQGRLVPCTAARGARCLSTAPPAAKSRSWKSFALRWGLAGGIVYFYNTNTLLAEEPEAAIERLDQSMHHIQESNLPTLEAIEEERRRRRAETAQQAIEKQEEMDGKTELAQVEAGDRSDMTAESPDERAASAEDLEEEADQQGAFNPETGEINWDCPCLGGMAHGPCGEQFKAAFSCFVYSKEEPKGMDCIDKFKGMQDCFREHPEMYGSELEDDDVEEEIEQQELAQHGQQNSVADAKSQSRSEEGRSLPASSQRQSSEQPTEADSRTSPKSESSSEKVAGTQVQSHSDASSATAPQKHLDGDEGGELVTRSAFDATNSNAGK